jgi:predicted house-cleaning noncanonical NTP pyrophosphatase (MazG superfamily)
METKVRTFETLVRDLLPEQIEAKGHKVATRVVEGADYYQALRDTLQQEVNEFFVDNNTEELADILEVVYALAHMMGVDRYELEEVRQRKLKRYGGFDKRLFLETVEEVK